MNLFRSEEHVRNWKQFDPASEDGIMPVAGFAQLFGIAMFRERLAPDYVLRLRDLAREFMPTLARLGRDVPFWQARPPS